MTHAPSRLFFTGPVTALLLASLIGALIGAVGCSSSGVNALTQNDAGGGFDAQGIGQDAAGIGSAQCSNGIDDDHDGLTDYFDPECVGGLDDDESSFATGIPGDNMDACKQDCFFDGNSGAGDDGCDWQLKCDPVNTNAKCPYDEDYASKESNLAAERSDLSTRTTNASWKTQRR